MFFGPGLKYVHVEIRTRTYADMTVCIAFYGETLDILYVHQTFVASIYPM